MNMSTFNKLVKQEDRNIIIDTLSNMIICNYGSIDMLIVFAKQILKVYKKDSKIRGLCRAKYYAKKSMANAYPNCHIFHPAFPDPLEIFFTRKCAKKYISDPNGFDMRPYYWWNVTYSYEYSNNPAGFYEEGMSRFAKPRIMFMNWVIDVLTAYKNEYADIHRSSKRRR